MDRHIHTVNYLDLVPDARDSPMAYVINVDSADLEEVMVRRLSSRNYARGETPQDVRRRYTAAFQIYNFHLVSSCPPLDVIHGDISVRWASEHLEKEGQGVEDGHCYRQPLLLSLVPPSLLVTQPGLRLSGLSLGACSGAADDA